MDTRNTKHGASISGPNNDKKKRLDHILNLLIQQGTRLDNFEQDIRDIWDSQNQNENPRVEEKRIPKTNQDNIVKELGKDLKKVTPKFDGKTIGDGAEAWVFEMEKYFELQNFFDETKAMWGSYQLTR